MAERSRHQQKIIKNYYDNRETIALQRLQELVTELYLAEGAKKRERYWKSVETHLEKLGVKQNQIDHIVSSDNAELLAKHLTRLMDKAS